MTGQLFPVALMGAEPHSAPQWPADPGVSTPRPLADDACLNYDITVEELSQCSNRLKAWQKPWH